MQKIVTSGISLRNKPCRKVGLFLSPTSLLFSLTLLRHRHYPIGWQDFRQPKAIKTNIKELDECYVYTFKQNAGTLVREIKTGLEDEGLGDIAGRIVNDEGGNGAVIRREREIQYRPGFKHFEGKIYLPKFAVQEKNSWRDLNFETDILSAIDWEKININGIDEITLSETRTGNRKLLWD